MDDDEFLTQYLVSKRYPKGFGLWIGKTKDTVFGRYVIVDNSRSMLNRDGQLFELSSASMQPCTRWKMIGATVQTMAEISHAAQSPGEFSLLNPKEKSNAVVVGIRQDDGASLEAIQNMLDTTPIGNTPVSISKSQTLILPSLTWLFCVVPMLHQICNHIRYLAERIESMEDTLREQNKIAVIVLLTDGESTDGNVADAMRQLEDLPVAVIISIYATEPEVTEYWHNVVASVKNLDITVLNNVQEQAKKVEEMNDWMTYGEPLHRLREFGVLVPIIDTLEERPLKKNEIKSVTEILLAPSGQELAHLPDPEVVNWSDFVDAVQSAVNVQPSGTALVFCPIRGEPRSWVDCDQLAKLNVDDPPAIVPTTSANVDSSKPAPTPSGFNLSGLVTSWWTAPTPTSPPIDPSTTNVPMPEEKQEQPVVVPVRVPMSIPTTLVYSSVPSELVVMDNEVDVDATNPEKSGSAGKSPLASPNLTLNTALDENPKEVVDGVDKGVEEDDVIARQVESARSVAGDAALALTAAKKVLNESPQGEDSVDALEVVFKLEVAKSGADQALAELIGMENKRKIEMERQRAPTPGGALGTESGFWNNLNLWPAYPPSTNTPPVTAPLDGNDTIIDPSLGPGSYQSSRDVSENGQSNSSKARFSLLREAEEKNDRLQELQRQLNADPSTMNEQQRDALLHAMQRAAAAKADIDNKLRAMLTEVKKETSQAVAEAESALGRAKDDNNAAAVAEDKLRQAKIAERYLDDKLEEVGASMEEEKTFVPGGLAPLSNAAVDAATANAIAPGGSEEGTFSGAASPQGSAFYMGITGQDGLLGITNAATTWFANPEDVQAAKTAADEEIAALKEQLRSVVDKNEKFESEVDKLRLQATEDEDELERLRRLLGEKTNQYEEEKVQNKKTNNELAILTKKHKELAEVKAIVDKQVESLTAQGKKDALELSAQKKQLDESTAKLTALAVEYKGYKDKTEQIIIGLQAQVKKDEVDIAALKKRISDLEHQVKSITEENELSEDEIVALKKTIAEWEVLCKQNAAEIATANKEIASLNAQSQKDRDEIEALKKRILELEIHQVALVNEYQAHKTTTEQTIADLETANKQTKDQLIALANEYQSYKTTSEKSISELNANLVKVQEEYTKHLKECTLVAEKAAKSIADLETANSQLKDQMTALAKEYQTYKTTSEQTVGDLNASLVKIQNEYSQHLRDCTLAAEKAAKTIADLESAVASNQQAFSAHLQQCTTAQAATEAEIKDLQEQLKTSKEKDKKNDVQIEELLARMNDLKDIITDEKDQNVHLHEQIEALRKAKEVVDRQRDDLELFVKLPRTFDCPPDIGDSGRACVRPSQSQRPITRSAIPLSAGKAASGGYDPNSEANSYGNDEQDEIPPPTSVPTGRGPMWSSPGRPRSPAPTMSSPAPSIMSANVGSSAFAGILPDLRPGGGQSVLDQTSSISATSSSQSQSSQPTKAAETTQPPRGKIYRGRLETFIVPGELPSSSAGLDITSSLLGEALQKGAGTWFDFISPSM